VFEHGPAGVAQVGFLSPQARSDRPNVWDLAGAQAVDVGGACPFLLRGRDIGQCRAACSNRKKKTKNEGNMSAPCGPSNSDIIRLHDGFPPEYASHDGEYVKYPSRDVIFLTLIRQPELHSLDRLTAAKPSRTRFFNR
jgi:hypothetical protein